MSAQTHALSTPLPARVAAERFGRPPSGVEVRFTLLRWMAACYIEPRLTIVYRIPRSILQPGLLHDAGQVPRGRSSSPRTYAAYVPDLPGYIATGASEEEAAEPRESFARPAWVFAFN